MGQHSDILTLTISKGIIRGLSASTIVNDVIDFLEILEYENNFTEQRCATEHVYSCAKEMLRQDDGVYGVSHGKLNAFLEELRLANQWLDLH